MNFQNSDKVSKLTERLEKFMDANIYPVEQSYRQAIQASENRWVTPALMNELKGKARQEELWNLFLPDDEYGAGLSNLEYAPLAELMGRVLWCSEVFNCSAPDTGNMEVLAQYGSQAQKKQWLTPLLNGEIRSAFAMTEPAVASSDATNIECSIVADGDDYLINGRKWFITGAMHENCRILIVMGKTAPDNPDRHRQQSMILVPMDTPGVKVERPLTTLGYDDPPFGHAELSFTDVRVPAANLILGEGRGFEIAQGRLGPGRIHHCMRLVGLAQRGLEAMCRRAEQRVAFGKKLSEQGSVREDIAKSACEIDQARLLTLKTADTMDRDGNKAARNEIAMIKIIAPAMACRVLDRAIQIHGAAGLHDDLFLSEAYTYARQIRLADGPDQVHMNALGRWLVREHN
ncbi:MAG: acyl-CoA dehydrogenase family protein [Proteobacteria bacterium]|nr:acyl-CoA dehydrogenase family protein [Pseudomonadota bacterium]